MKALAKKTTATGPLIIHGGSGKTLTVVPAQVENYETLEKAAKAGFYYPYIAIKQLKALAQGPGGKKYIYIPNASDAKTNSMQVLNVYLPGIMATVERRPNDTYALTYMELSEGYELLSSESSKPGIYRVLSTSEKLDVEFKKSGNITREDNRTVVICDGGYSQPDYAAQDALKHLKKISGDQAILRGDFDIMYSPIGDGLGKKSYNPINDTSAYSSAVILAKAMKGASKRKGVYWVSQYGGSSVLTMAMRSLADQNITLPSHLAKLYKPKTSIEEARTLAKQLDLKTGNDFATSPSTRGQFEQLKINYKRMRNKDDKYGVKNFGSYVGQNALSANQVVGLPLYATSLAAGATGFLGIAGLAVSGIGAAHLTWTLCKNFSEKPNFR